MFLVSVPCSLLSTLYLVSGQVYLGGKLAKGSIIQAVDPQFKGSKVFSLEIILNNERQNEIKYFLDFKAYV